MYIFINFKYKNILILKKICNSGNPTLNHKSMKLKPTGATAGIPSYF